MENPCKKCLERGRCEQGPYSCPMRIYYNEKWRKYDKKKKQTKELMEKARERADD
ncbi:MAG: hypothetical protein LUF92_02180 [Clostridiales bacterium]|nr:hypothetical protein [Clostridiales bacterium]